MENMKIKISDIDLHVVDFGGSGLETILLVHGLTANARYWDAVAERLVKDYRVLALDLRGRGESGKPAAGYYDLWQYARDLKELAEALSLDQMILMGHSLGAMVGVVFASQHAEHLSRLVLVDGGVEFVQEELKLLEEALSLRLHILGTVFADWHTYLEFMKKNPNHRHWNHYIERYYWHDVHHHDDGSVVSKTPRHAALPFQQRPASLNELGARIDVPTLLLQAPEGLQYGSENVVVVPPEKAKHFISKLPEGSRFAQIDGANHHSIILNHYEALVDMVKGFLQDTAQP